MRIKLKYPDVETFIQKYAVNISRGGIFIATKSPKAVGTFVRFEFLLSDATTTSIIRGEGQVQWTKEFDPAHPTKAHGMGVKFSRLDAGSQAVIDRALRWRADHGTNPGAPVPIPTSSAHTISAGRSESQEEKLPAPEAEPQAASRRRRRRSRRCTRATGGCSRRRPRPPSSRRCARQTDEPLPPMPGRGETRPISDRARRRRSARAAGQRRDPAHPARHLAARAAVGRDRRAGQRVGSYPRRSWRASSSARAGGSASRRRRSWSACCSSRPSCRRRPRPRRSQQLAALLSKKNGRNGTH